MPRVTSTEPASGAAAKPSRAAVSWWTKLHFSGRVIMCSILFGFGLVLIGGIVLATNTNDDSSPSLDTGYPDEMPTKPPSNIVGPVVMGIGGFIVIAGVLMCLFETQVCQKKNSENRALINEGANDVESSLSRSPRLDKAKPGSSHKRIKGRHGKSRRTEKTPSPSLKSVAVPIVSPRNALTSSSEAFLTPPSTFGANQDLPFSSPIEDENRPLESPINYSSGQWSKSSEFQTPCASFKDNSMSFSSSTEISSLINDIRASEFQRSAEQSNLLTQETQAKNKTQDLISELPEQKEKSKLEPSVKDNSTTWPNSTEIGDADNGISASELQRSVDQSNLLTQETQAMNKTQDLTTESPEQKEKMELETAVKDNPTTWPNITEIGDTDNDISAPEFQSTADQVTSLVAGNFAEDKTLEPKDESERYEFLTPTSASVQENSTPAASRAENGDASNQINHLDVHASSLTSETPVGAVGNVYNYADEK